MPEKINDDLNIEIKQPIASQSKLNKTNCQEKEPIWKSSARDFSNNSSMKSINAAAENTDKMTNLVTKKNRVRVYRSLDSQGLHKIIEKSSGMKDKFDHEEKKDKNKLSRYE